MAAARYWRLVGIETYAGGDLELSELHLYGASGRLDAAATLTSTVAPIAGTLANLQDDDLATVCRFAGASVRAGGFALVWDFGAGNAADAIGLRLGAAARGVFMASVTLQYGNDGLTWNLFATFGQYAWPGAGTYTLAPAVGDVNYGNVSLLLHFDGSNGSTTFTDSSPVPKALTAYSGAAISTVQSQYGGASAYFPGSSGNRITVPAGDHFNFGAGDFTIEALVYVTSLADNRTIISQYGFSGNRAWDLLVVSGMPHFRCTSNGSSDIIGLFAQTVQTNAWHHIAVTRDASQFRLFLNGSLAQTQSSSAPVFSSSFTAAVGYNQEGAWPFVGYIDELRITKGVARYTADFTPPTAAFPDSATSANGTVFVSPTLYTGTSAAHIAASSPVPTFSTRKAPALAMARDVEHGGPGTIYGTTKTKGTPNAPTKARVVLLHQRSKLPVRETWSDPVTGAFVFSGIDTSQQFLALAEDAAGHFRPVVANRLTPEVL